MTDVRLATHPSEFDALPSSALRERFLVDQLFATGEVRFCLSQGDRVLIGGAMHEGQTN
jgi:4-deoxy-L-threo-5-hexosulose-uronate ketol-isomerase